MTPQESLTKACRMLAICKGSKYKEEADEKIASELDPEFLKFVEIFKPYRDLPSQLVGLKRWQAGLRPPLSSPGVTRHDY